MASDGGENRSYEEDFLADSPLRQLYDRRYDFDFSILGDHHFRYPSSDHEFEPRPWKNGLIFGKEEEPVGMRRQRGAGGSGGGGGAMIWEEMVGGNEKRARVGSFDEDARWFDEAVRERAERGGFEGSDVGACETRKLDGRTAEMSTVDCVNGNDIVWFVDFLGVGESLGGSLDGAEPGLGLSADAWKGKEVVLINLDGNDADKQVVDWGENSKSGNESVVKTNSGIGLNLGMVDVGSLGERSSSQRRYTKEEKGKNIVVGDWLSIATKNHQLAYSESDVTYGTGGGDIHVSGEVEQNQDFAVVNEQHEDCFLPDVNGTRLWEPEEYLIPEAVDAAVLPLTETPDEPPMSGLHAVQDKAFLIAREQANRRRMERRRFKEIAKENALQLAHPERLSVAESQRHEIKEITGPFSMAMQKIIEHREGKYMFKSQLRSFSIDWTPSSGKSCKLMAAKIPSLLDLSVAALAKNAESIVSLEPAPDVLKRRVSQAACDLRKMDSHLLEILVSESPTEIYVKDCSWMTEEQLVHIFGGCDTENLTVLQLDLCGQALTKHTLSTSLAQSKNCLPSLAILSLKSACRLTEGGLASIIESAPILQSINLSQCSLLTDCGISTLANCLGSKLKELYIDDCQNIDALSILPALLKFEHLEVLSVSGINTVSDEFVSQFICARGSNLKELGLADCQKLTDSSLKIIGQTCSQLCALDVSNLNQLTDATMEYIANGCRSIQKLKFCRSTFSDEAVASFLEVSGQSLKELSLNHISKVGHYTALSVAKNARNLLYLDLSWCRRLKNEALGLVVDSCLSLRLLKLFGCTQITEVFLNGHSNPNVEIIGLNKMPLLKHVSSVDPQPGPLRYGPLITSECL